MSRRRIGYELVAAADRKQWNPQRWWLWSRRDHQARNGGGQDNKSAQQQQHRHQPHHHRQQILLGPDSSSNPDDDGRHNQPHLWKKKKKKKKTAETAAAEGPIKNTATATPRRRGCCKGQGQGQGGQQQTDLPLAWRRNSRNGSDQSRRKINRESRTLSFSRVPILNRHGVEREEESGNLQQTKKKEDAQRLGLVFLFFTWCLFGNWLTWFLLVAAAFATWFFITTTTKNKTPKDQQQLLLVFVLVLILGATILVLNTFLILLLGLFLCLYCVLRYRRLIFPSLQA